MRNKKGQALVEFVIILPIFILLVFCLIDFGRIISIKNDLENKISDVVTFYQNGNSKDEIIQLINKNSKDKINIEFVTEDEYVTINLVKKINPITPGITYIKKDLFDVSVSRVIKNE